MRDFYKTACHRSSFCDAKPLAFAVMQDGFLLSNYFLFEKAMVLSNLW